MIHLGLEISKLEPRVPILQHCLSVLQGLLPSLGFVFCDYCVTVYATMTITIITVGAQSKQEYAALCQSYLKRLPRHIRVTWQLIKHGPGDRIKSVRTESENILKSIPAQATVILLDERGRTLTSPELSSAMFSRHAAGTAAPGGHDVVFIIGGAYGVDRAVQNRADIVVSLGKLVYPHHIVRLILCEQIYRSYTIHTNHPYHHS